MFKYAHIVLRDIRHYRSRSLLCIAGIAVIVAVFLVLSAVATGMANMVSGSEGSSRNLALVDKGVVDYCQGQIPAAVVGRLRRWPGLAYVAPMFHTPVQVKGKMIFIRGVPLDNYMEVENIEILRGEGLKRGDHIIVGQQLARLNKWDVGDEIEIAGRSLKISGIFRGNGFLNTEMWMTLEDGERILGQGKFYSLVLLQVAPDADLKAVRDRLENSSYLTKRVDVATEKELNDKMGKSFKQIEETMNAVSLLALVAIVFGIFNVVSMTVAEKGREIGILKAVGLSRREVTGIYLLEGLTQAALGYLVGLLLGAAMVTYLGRSSAVDFASMPLTPELSAETVGLSVGLTSILTLLGAYFPARHAAGITVVEALREV
ncbi:MAG: ABC transporter permease [Anaerolineae bacterium]